MPKQPADAVHAPAPPPVAPPVAPLDGWIYADNCATTAVAPEVLAAMLPYFEHAFGNPSSSHPAGLQARAGLTWARQTLAALTGTNGSQWTFTSGGTESNNLVLRGLGSIQEPGHALLTTVEHPSVAAQEGWLRSRRWQVEHLEVDAQGFITADEIDRKVRPDTRIVSILWANNEIGTIQPISELGAAIRARTQGRAHLHVDAVQAFTKVPWDWSALPIDSASLSAHKFHGPKGVGALYLARPVVLAPQIDGGGQERGLRAGTENVPGAVGLAAAAQLAFAAEPEALRAMERLRDRLIEGALALGDVSLNGCPTNRLPHHASLNFHGAPAALMLDWLTAHRICASAGAACHAGSAGLSPSLQAIGHARDEGAIRLSISRSTTQDEVDQILQVLATAVPRARAGQRPPVAR